MPDKDVKTKTKIINTVLIFILGISLGVFSKWLDNLSINDAIWWQHLLGMVDLRNVFSEFGVWIFLAVVIAVFSKTPVRASINVFLFFVGMTVSYHLYTIYFSGFNPQSYMMIWYGITAITPILAFVCWYARGNTIIATVISGGILAIMIMVSFSLGILYFSFRRTIDILLFLGTVIALHTTTKKTICSLETAIVLTIVLLFLI